MNKKNIPANLRANLIIFFVSTVLLVFLYGVAVGHYEIFPYHYFAQAEIGFNELKNQGERSGITGKANKQAKPGIGFARVRKPYPPPVTNSERAMQGINLVTRLAPQPQLTASVDLLDMEGQLLHRWDTDVFRVWPKPNHMPKHLIPKSKPGAHIHGTVLLENGDLIYNYDHFGLVRLARDGEVLWRLPYRTHHSIHLHDDGNLWVSGQKLLKERDPLFPHRPYPVDKYTILEVNLEGEVLNEWFVADILHANGYAGLLHLGKIKPTMTKVKQVLDDRLHLNDVEPFPNHLQEGFFKRGDILVSLRDVSTVFVFNRYDGLIKYISTGMFVNQHDPDFIDGNTFSVFDNNVKKKKGKNPLYSRILIVSPQDSKVKVFFEGSPKNPFFTSIMGKHQWLSNGNLLISESLRGRAFEINKEGEVVWEFINYTGEGIASLVEEVSRWPLDYGQFTVPIVDKGQ